MHRNFFIAPDSRLPTPDSRLPTPYSLLTTPLSDKCYDCDRTRTVIKQRRKKYRNGRDRQVNIL
ncbi:MAG: hypothetical protein F6K63_20285 [Moorea sp. SIO1G6]|uniref:hypothetical protein n=1 Tax=Moorena sp. SIO1G6 TaxID=2607840 RepID=UPI0013C1595E|nr:hypothetical protein [Moorena sp. SIO1G6]NET66597.1 hypothetical protein [Moorena sp. SIO1G6]